MYIEFLFYSILRKMTNFPKSSHKEKCKGGFSIYCQIFLITCESKVFKISKSFRRFNYLQINRNLSQGKIKLLTTKIQQCVRILHRTVPLRFSCTVLGHYRFYRTALKISQNFKISVFRSNIFSAKRTVKNKIFIRKARSVPF